MAYRFTLADEEDDLTAALLDDPSYQQLAVQPQAAVPEPEVEAHQPWTPDVAQTRDPALQQQWQEAESRALKQSQYNPGEYGLGELARDHGGTALAALLSLVARASEKPSLRPDGTRKSRFEGFGQDLGNLVTANAGVAERGEAARRQQAREAGEFALKARGQKDTALSNELAVRRLQLQEQGLDEAARRRGISEEGEHRRQAALNREIDPNNAVIQRQKDEIVRASGGRITPDMVAGLDAKALRAMGNAYDLQFESANTPQKAADEATIAGSRETAAQTAENNVNIRDLPALGAARGVGAARAEEIERPGKVTTARQTATATGEAHEAIEAPIREAQAEEKAATAFGDKNSDLLNARDELAGILGRRDKDGNAAGTGRGERLAGALGVGGIFNSDDAVDNQQAQAAALTTIQHAATGASAGVKEAARIALSTFGDPTATPEQRTRAIQHTLDLIDADLAGRGAGRPSAAGKVSSARARKRKPVSTEAPSLDDWSAYEVK